MPAFSYIKSWFLVASAFILTPLLVSAAAERLSFLKPPGQLHPLSLATFASAATVRLSPAPGSSATTALPEKMSVKEASELPVPARHTIALEPLPAPEQRIRLKNVNTRERATFALSPRGFVRTEDEAALQRFFRCKRTGRKKPISNEVLVLLGAIARRWPDRVIEVVSGYRAPPYGVPHSRHFRGEAIDLRVRGVRTAKVRDFVWREHHGIGVGHYTAGDFVHVDTRSDEADTAWSARHEDGAYDYHPRWAKRARRSHKATPALAVASTTATPQTIAAH